MDFIKRVMKCAFNRAAGIRRHVEDFVKGRAQAIRVDMRLYTSVSVVTDILLWGVCV